MKSEVNKQVLFSKSSLFMAGRIREIGHSLDVILESDDWKSKLPSECEKMLFVCFNSESNYRLNLGVAPINDAVSFGELLKDYEFEIYFIMSPTKKVMGELLQYFMKITTKQLVVFYAGHGNIVRNIKSPGSVPSDPFVFGDGAITDGEFVNYVNQNRQPGCRLTLITDSCQKESIWDIRKGEIHGLQIPSDVISVSATVDQELLKDVKFEVSERGVFVTDLVKWLKRNPEITPKDLRFAMRKVMKKWGHDFAIGASTAELLENPLFL